MLLQKLIEKFGLFGRILSILICFFILFIPFEVVIGSHFQSWILSLVLFFVYFELTTIFPYIGTFVQLGMAIIAVIIDFSVLPIVSAIFTISNLIYAFVVNMRK